VAGPTRYLTKSRFKLAAECPRKLYYTGKPEYLDRSIEDSFLAALAEGGYQVGELACLLYPDGIRVDTLEHQQALEQTAELLKRDQVTIFEAALAFGTLFIRVDILQRKGSDIELIEVKAKSYSTDKDGDFRGAKGKIKSGFLKYLQDVAYQRHVAASALPALKVHASLMLVDKDKVSTVDRLNQRFKIRRIDGRLRVEVAKDLTPAALGQSLLAKVAVDGQIDELQAGSLVIGPGKEAPFGQAVDLFAKAYSIDKALPPIPSAACGNCQFKSANWPSAAESKSGFHECWAQAFGWKKEDFAGGTVLDLWYFNKKSELIDRKVLKPSQVTKEDIDFDGKPPGLTGMTRKHRQWYVCRPDWPGGGGYYFNKEAFLASSAKWVLPLHFIDFETSAVAIPFLKGRHPYAMAAFQFSHHTVSASGQVKHQSQWICTTPGKDPNVAFVRALRDALTADNGTIFRWAQHENTVLNQLRTQMLESPDPEADQDDLVSFIEQITTRSGSGKEKVTGPRNMVDLCDMAEKFYFHPSTNGSNSLKKVLPALMRSSTALRELYEKPTYGGEGVSWNFKHPMAWWQLRDGDVADPYLLLPPVFDDVPAEEIQAVEEGLSEDLREGGAAMAAYARLQFEDLSEARRQAIVSALLRYCELDTLAMVMAVQAWQYEARR
jgi:Domain of unknown function(DUF2779)